MEKWMNEMENEEFHHGENFWQLVEACCPNYLEAEKYLRTTGRILEI
jgi:predicted metal-dependent hydrolase